MIENESPAVHFLGIGGIEMSALAHIALERGSKVCGIDRNSSQVTRQLEEKGANIFIGDDAHFDAKMQVVYSYSIAESHPALQKAIELFIVSSFSVSKHADGRTTIHSCHRNSWIDFYNCNDNLGSHTCWL